jgi:hypothetical protein
MFRCLSSHLLCSPQNPKELFNLRHAQARNVVERAFGTIKKKFKMFWQPNHFPVRTQARIHLACPIMDNFIQKHDGYQQDPVIDTSDIDQGSEAERGDTPELPRAAGVLPEERRRADARRDAIANTIWASYLAEHVKRGSITPELLAVRFL